VMLTVDRSLTTQLFEHLGSASQSITRLANADVEDELLDRKLPHGVLGLLRRHLCGMLSTLVNAKKVVVRE
jgi:hypothetical protein